MLKKALDVKSLTTVYLMFSLSLTGKKKSEVDLKSNCHQ